MPLKIAHFYPFSPNCCGLAEAARDMIVADRLAGHESHAIDVGAYSRSKQVRPPTQGLIDDRGGSKIISQSPGWGLTADLIVAHTGVPDNFIVGSDAPIVWVAHGRPRACFLPESMGQGNSYTLLHDLMTWPRVKKLLSFWPYHREFWRVIVPEEKMVFFDFPPIDGNRFSPCGVKADFAEKGGRFNIVIAESAREDIDIYEIVHALFLVSKKITGLKVHLYGMGEIRNGWQFILQKLKDIGILGEVWTRRQNMEEVYRAADLLISPQRIVTRSVGEALSCGLSVIADHNNEAALLHADPRYPEQVAHKIISFYIEHDKQRTRRNLYPFSLSTYAETMTRLYDGILGQKG